MLHTSHSVRACACAILITIVSNVASLHADTILDTNTFSSSQPSGGGFVVATTQNFSLTSAEIADTTFEANFDFIDAGIEILVNGISLFATGDDVSQFNGGNQTVFTQTGAVNLGIPFGPTGDGTPRLTVQSDSTGTQFLGPDLAANGAGNIINYQPLQRS